MGVTDKIELGYDPTYKALAAELFPRMPLRILEVGVQTGAGLDYLAEVFDTFDVYGVDIDTEAGRPEQRDRIITSPQEHPGLPMVLAPWAPFQLIVDDASHQAGPTAVTLANLWPLVAPGGAYVIEDWNYFEGPGVAQNLWQKLLGYWLAYPFPDHHDRAHPYSGMLHDIDSVLIRQGMIVIRRAP